MAVELAANACAFGVARSLAGLAVVCAPVADVAVAAAWARRVLRPFEASVAVEIAANACAFGVARSLIRLAGCIGARLTSVIDADRTAWAELWIGPRRATVAFDDANFDLSFVVAAERFGFAGVFACRRIVFD